MFNKNIEKLGKVGIAPLIVGIFFLLLAIGISAYFIFDANTKMKNPIPLKDAKEGDYAKIDVYLMTDYFATEDSSSISHKSYFIWDNNRYFIADLNEETRKQLNEIYEYSYSEEDLEEPEVVTIKGIATEIPSTLKDIAIKSFNQLAGENIVTSLTYKDYFGSVYLDTYENPMTLLVSKLIYAVPSLILAIICLVSYFHKVNTTKKSITKLGSKWENVLSEIRNTDTIYFQVAKLYLTRNYVVSEMNGLEIFAYSDIVWIYPYEYRYNGVLSQKSIFVVTKDSKAHRLANVSASKKNLLLYDNLYDTFLNKVPNALNGYTNENKVKVKEMYEK